MSSSPQLLTDPFLQLPTATGVRVVWFTEFAGSRHIVTYGEDLNFTAVATTIKLSRTREDERSKVGKQRREGEIYEKIAIRHIWRHEAEVTGLTPLKRIPYRVTSVREDGESVSSDVFTLAASPPAGMPLKILLTSDHQLMPMTPANLQKVAETVQRVDAVFFVGDLVNVPDRASEWFDDNRGVAFFPCLQGRANGEITKNGITTVYTGGQLIQHAPIFPALGNHEVMGRFSMLTELKSQFSNPFPLTVSEQIYDKNAQALNPNNDPEMRRTWLKNHSFNTDTYEEIFTLPSTSPGGKRYYAVTLGDVRLVVPFIACVWRIPSLGENAKGKYREREQDFDKPMEWGYGQHIFEPIKKGSTQYNWLVQELNSPEFKNAKYKIVMFHHPAHTLGENIVPAFTDPVQKIERNLDGKIQSIRYEYPQHEDYIIRDVLPLLESAGVQLVFFGHSHLWNRFVSDSGMHFLESSNVGNSYGAFIGEERRNNIPIGYQEEYVATGDPNKLDPIVPTIAPLIDENAHSLPYVASNDITVFTILDTATATVSSYRFDTTKGGEVIKFDEFKLKESKI
ncbi:metallophosphoesterase family protein [Aerosakkonema funiforme]|uniref:Metallophosphoesterase family protein n=2 Tax=Oscillatoriophycideae TaxID=1301283 RepID=A0A926ZJ91_9CYAN|nr:metallophosphoesterase family protein [Aerosakkonema funiforme]MBD2185303.1 metallophosphoesterase family protein [Aerosakkonema funiforme FACHB-1375]